jgi:hypothetical protein
MPEYSYNGWLASTNPADFGGLTKISVAGEFFPPGVRSGDVTVVFQWLVEQLHARVEPVTKGHEADDWGYNYRKNRNANNLSCHSSGTALDYNAVLHPNGRRGTFSGAQVAEIRRILAECDGIIRWGGDFSGTPDEMHFEIVGDVAAVARVAARLRGTPVVVAAKPASRWFAIPMGGTTSLHATGEQVRRDQADLIDTGYDIAGGADGFAGEATVAAIRTFQTAAGILIDGQMGPATRATIHKVPSWSGVSLIAAQRRLGHYGHRLVLDGQLGPNTKAALTAFQARVKLSPDGQLGPMTWTALHTR